MATRGQSPEVRQARARAREIARGRQHLSPRLTAGHRAAQSRAELERKFGDLPYSRFDPTPIRNSPHYNSEHGWKQYNAQDSARRLGNTTAEAKQQVMDAEYWTDLEWDGDDADDPFFYH